MTRIELTVARLWLEEGCRLHPYNDATGKTVTCRPSGNLTWLVGCNLETAGTERLAKVVLTAQLEDFDADLRHCGWYTRLDEARGSVFLDCAFNEGFAGLLRHAADAIAYADRLNWIAAQDAFLKMGPAKMLPHRYEPLGRILLTGVP